MRKLVLLTMVMLMGLEASAQTPYPKDEVKRLRRLVTQTKSRAPLPKLMSFDRFCIDELHDLSEWDEQIAKLKDDSIQRRHKENKFIQEHRDWAGPKILKSGTYDKIVSQIEREELRYDLYERVCRILASNRAADQRTEPTGELLSVSYGSSGMRYNPDLPFTIERVDGDSALVTYSYNDIQFKVDVKYLEMMHEVIISQHLYQLHSNYDFNDWELPDIPKYRMLDGQRWTFEARYSDGTVINSSGMVPAGLKVEEIPKIYFDAVLPNSEAYKKRNSKE